MKEVAHGFHNLHAHIIKGAFERRMEELKTKFDKFMNYYFFLPARENRQTKA